jgi:hypothetical protein
MAKFPKESMIEMNVTFDTTGLKKLIKELKLINSKFHNERKKLKTFSLWTAIKMRIAGYK